MTPKRGKAEVMTTRKRNRGWLWVDNSKDTLRQKIGRAITKYQDKFGCRPSAIYINIATYLKEADPKLRLCGLPIIGNRGIPLHHFWLEHGGSTPHAPEEREENSE